MVKQYYIGLMSGTSMDGVDAVLVNFDSSSIDLAATHTESIPDNLYNRLQPLLRSGNDDEINRLGTLDRRVAQLFAQTVNNLIDKSGIKKEQIIAIGSHGQTVRHMPNLEMGFTLQIGDPNTIAALTGIDVIADFRRKDIALGGQGAPLVPAFHQKMFAKPHTKRIILNIGGIANITYLLGDTSTVIGFDTGPGNTLIDSWIRQHQGKPYDKSGAWAAKGTCNEQLLEHLMSHPYFALTPPKSTGRELFNQAWLEQQTEDFGYLDETDIQATLLALTCRSIANDCLKLTESAEMFVCGGGAFNTELLRLLAQQLPQYNIATTTALGVDPRWVEAAAFAWLAMRYHHKLSGNLPSVTGASKPAVLGGFFPAD